jgi:hypothetical protein
MFLIKENCIKEELILGDTDVLLLKDCQLGVSDISLAEPGYNEMFPFCSALVFRCDEFG